MTDLFTELTRQQVTFNEKNTARIMSYFNSPDNPIKDTPDNTITPLNNNVTVPAADTTERQTNNGAVNLVVKVAKELCDALTLGIFNESPTPSPTPSPTDK